LRRSGVRRLCIRQLLACFSDNQKDLFDQWQKSLRLSPRPPLPRQPKAQREPNA
jgi:hypothetical protein